MGVVVHGPWTLPKPEVLVQDIRNLNKIARLVLYRTVASEMNEKAPMEPSRSSQWNNWNSCGQL